MKLLIGTGNPAKTKHYEKFLKGWGVKLVSAFDAGVTEKPEETGMTLEENAILKAKFYFERSGLPTLADDAGFEIPALNNWPGVNSHRLNGRGESSDEEIIDTVINRMKGLKGERRQAKMKIVLALALFPDNIKTASGEIEGIVPEKPYDKIELHFPYRSLLFVPKLNKWFYDIGVEKNGMDHRKIALEKLKSYLTP